MQEDHTDILESGTEIMLLILGPVIANLDPSEARNSDSFLKSPKIHGCLFSMCQSLTQAILEQRKSF